MIKSDAGSARRNFFRQILAGSAISGAPSLIPGAKSNQLEVAPRKSEVHWVHGGRAMLGRPVELDVLEHGLRKIRGASFSQLTIHFDLPVPADSAIEAIWLRVETQRGATIHALSLFDCEEAVTRLEKLGICSEQLVDLPFVLPQSCVVKRSMSVILDCEFEGSERDIVISALGYQVSQETKGTSTQHS
ncbi:hypothetical protein RF679_01310 [Undibacterium cyanobacteriorum]|uniref:Uncharacterized protein n=1 Tax=Undibacterium cyanobacteriorum TaxID=3073561 RepID=A0ABY9RJU6_9BURK|nr:hypothetical protein [Undibacterium sp. 20NA77.5]WMW80934.1 hypothetical protein RF679_01310 [Undibacterium sp. 20NA77.5]